MEYSVEQRVRRVIANIKKITPEAVDLDHSIETICETSMDWINFLYDLEDEFNVRIPMETTGLKTIQEIVTVFQSLTKKQKIVEDTFL